MSDPKASREGIGLEAGVGGETLAGSAGRGDVSRSWRKLRRHRLAYVGLICLAILMVSAVFAPLLSVHDPFETSLIDRLQPPGPTHWMGTDELGRDVFARVLHAGRISLGVGLMVGVLSVAIGGLYGATSAFIGGKIDEIAMRFVDVVRALPALPFLIVFSAVLLERDMAGGFWSIVVVLVVFMWTDIARIVRGVVLSLKEQDFTMAARSVGVPAHRIILRHLLPNTLAPMIVATTLGAGVAIIAESSLSFLGIGIQPPTPSWGNMLFNAQSYLWTNPWIAVFPGLFIFVTLLSINFLGDGLRDAFDPRAISTRK